MAGLLPAAPFVPGAPSAVAETNPEFSQIRYQNIFYAYVQAGENLDVSFTKFADSIGSVANDGALDITVQRPDGAIETCSLDGNEPVGDPSAECNFTNRTFASTGVWVITFGAPKATGIDSPRSDYFEWDITVQNGTTDIPGRVWVEEYVMTQHPSDPEPSDFSLWYQSEQGYQYRADYTQYDGLDSVFSSNATGVARAGGCVSAYRSIEVPGSPAADPRFYVPTTQCGDRYKIFFDQPSGALPATVTLPDGSTDWLVPPVVEPALSGLDFEQDPGAVRKGTFRFNSLNFNGNAELQIDADNNGSYNDPIDVSQPISINSSGPQAVAFDGINGLNAPIPNGQSIRARVIITRVGEIHFALEDAEQRDAFRVTALNGAGEEPTTIYWNDTFLSEDGRDCTTPILDGTAGVDSAAGVHGWECFVNANTGFAGSWGDYRVIDDWTYQAIEEQTELLLPAIPTITQTKVLDGPPQFNPGNGVWTINYLITESATGAGANTYDLEDELMFGANMNVIWATVSAANAETPTPSTSWDGQNDLVIIDDAPITAGETHTYRVRVEVELTAPQGGTFGECKGGEDFYNQARLTPEFGVVEIDSACAEPDTPAVTLDKSILSTTYNAATQEYTITYRVTASASGTGTTEYTVTDELDYGPNVDVVSASISANSGSPTPLPSWNGDDQTTIVANQGITGGNTHRWTVVVTARLLPTWEPTPGACTAGNDFFNDSTLTITGDPAVQHDDECAEPETPAISHVKRLVGADSQGGDDYTVTYAIDVTATGQGTGFYDLSDELDYADTMTITGVDLTPPAGVVPIAAWDGQTNLAIVDDQPIAGGTVHTYLITVDVEAVTLNDPGTCDPGIDFYNRSTLITRDGTEISNACAEPVLPAISHTKTVNSVTFDTDTNEYVVSYTLTVASTGTGARFYNLLDTLAFPSNVTVADTLVTSWPSQADGQLVPSWNGSSQNQIATNVLMTGGETHEYDIVVRAQLTAPNPVPNDPDTCSQNQGDFANTSIVVAGAQHTANACAERPEPDVTPSKEIVDVSLDPATGVYTITYLLEQSASGGAGQTFYDLDDEFDFGPTVEVLSANATSADATLVPGWTGLAPNVRLVDDQLITSGETDAITVVVEVRLTGATPGNDPGTCTAGLDLHNDATVNPDTPDEATASACEELPGVSYDKAVFSGPTPVPGAPGQYTITYELTVTETSGALPAAFDLTDELRFGPDVTIVEVQAPVADPAPLAGLQAGWNGDSNTLLVDNGVIDAGATQRIRITVVIESLLPHPADDDGAACSGGGTGLDEDLANTSVLASNGTSITGDACAPAPHPRIDHTKTLTDVTPNGDGTYAVTYEVVAGNTGNGAGVYDLSDTLRFGQGVEIVGQPTVTAGAPVVLVPGWNGTTATALAADQPIEPAAEHTYTINVTVRPAAAVTGAATDCILAAGETGTGLLNEAALTWTGGTATRQACDELPGITVSKAITSGPSDIGNDEHQVGYTITVTNNGAGPGQYTLVDELTYGSNVTVVSAAAANVTPGDIPLNADWNGLTNSTVASNVTIGASGVHTYTVNVIFRVASTTNTGVVDCTLVPGETGTGLLNTATVSVDGTNRIDTACSEVVPPPPPPPTTTTTTLPPGPPPTPAPGPLPGTGGDSMSIVRIAVALIAFGAFAVVLASRRRRPGTSAG